MIDLVVKNANRAPEGGVASIAVYGLLIRFVGLGELLLRHVATTEQVPTLRVVLIRSDRFLEELDRSLLGVEIIAFLVVEPTKLLQHLRVVRIAIQYTLIGGFGGLEVTLLFMYMANLEQDVGLVEW